MDGYGKRRIDDSVTPPARTVCHSDTMTDREGEVEGLVQRVVVRYANDRKRSYNYDYSGILPYLETIAYCQDPSTGGYARG